MNGIDPLQVLFANLRSTRFPSRRVDVTLTSTLADGTEFTARSRILSRFEATTHGLWKFDVMSRVIDGEPCNGRFLIEQRSGTSPWPLTWVRDPSRGAARRYAFQPWQPFPLCALRWMDHILPPPGTFTASLNTTAGPSDPDWAPPATCWVVDLTLASTFWIPEPRLMRLWIDQTAGRAVDHRVEQHLSNGRVRVLLSEEWRQNAPGSPWGPLSRLIEDPELGARTAIRLVDPLQTDPIDPDLFNPVVMAEQNW